MLSFQPRASINSDKELTHIAVGSAVISHGHYASMTELYSAVKLIRKCSSIDRLPSFASPRWVSSLDHERLDYTVKDGIIVVTLQAKLNEVSASFGCLSAP